MSPPRADGPRGPLVPHPSPSLRSGGALGRLLIQVNHSRLFARRVSLWGNTFRACSADRLLALWLFRSGLMGRAGVSATKRLVRPGARAVDVGANQGVITLLLSGLVGATGEVVALEPDPLLFRALAENCRANRAENVTLHCVAASDRRGAAVLHRNAMNWGDNRLDSVPGPGAEVGVDVVPLDEILAGRPVDFVKIDVQGHEPRVLSGMSGVLASRQRPVLLFEYSPAALRAAGHEPSSLLSTLRALGYRLFALGPDGLDRPLDDGVLSALRGPFGYLDVVGRPGE